MQYRKIANAAQETVVLQLTDELRNGLTESTKILKDISQPCVWVRIVTLMVAPRILELNITSFRTSQRRYFRVRILAE